MSTALNPLFVRFYFDEDADVRLAVALRQRGYDIVTTSDAGLLEASDEEQLVYAASQQRALVTHNIAHFPGMHMAWVEASREHWGVIILIGHSAVSAWLRRMENLMNRFSAEELQASIYWE